MLKKRHGLSAFVFVCLLLAGLVLAAGFSTDPVSAATEKATVGKISSGSNTVTQKDSISLGTVDLSKLTENDDRYIVSYRMAIQFEKNHTFYYDGIYTADSKPAGGTFSCSDIVNQSYYKYVTFTVSFDAAYLSAGKYTAIVYVPLDNKVNANGGVYKCVQAPSGNGYLLKIPVSITLKGNNPQFEPAATGVTAKAGNGYAEVSWTAPAGCTSFSVYRRNGTDEAPARPDLDEYVFLDKVNTKSVNSWDEESGFRDTVYADYYAENGKTYSYIVISGTYLTQYSGNPSRSVSATPKASLRKKPAAPYWLSFNGTEAGISFSWLWDEKGGRDDPIDTSYEPQNPSGEGEVDHFNVYQNGRLVKQVQQKAYSTGEGYNDTINYSWNTVVYPAKSDVPYTFWVTAVAPDGTESLPSNKDTAWQEDEKDVAITDYHIFYTTEEVHDEETDKILAKYTGFYFEMGGYGVAHLKVWRKAPDAPDSDYKKVDLITTPEGKEMDTGVKKGKVYSYKIVSVSSDGRESEPVFVTVAADEGDWESAPGGAPLTLSFRTADGEAALLSWGAYKDGTYRLYRDGRLLKSWTSPNKELEYTDDPGRDGTYDYTVTWTSREFPACTVTSNVRRFVRDTSDPDPDSFDKAPGKPKLTGRVLGYEDSNWLKLMWEPSKDGGTPEGYVIYRTDGGVYNTHEWDHNLSWGNPKREAGEAAAGRYWCTKGDVNNFTIYDFSAEHNDGDAEHQELNPHRIWIVAYNEVGYSEPSEVLEYTSSETGLLPFDTDDSEPGAPENVSLRTEWTQNQYNPLSLSGRLCVSWSAPVSGGAVDHYDVALTNLNDTLTDTITVNVGGEQQTYLILHNFDAGDTYEVIVTAVNTKGQASSAPARTVIASIPALKAETAGTDSVKLTWAGLFGGEADSASEYQLWRRADASPWEKILTVAPGAPDPSSGCAYDSDDDRYTFTDEGLSVGVTYEYYVSAVDSGGKVHKSDPQAASLSTLDADLEAPKDLAAKNDKGDVILSWTPPASGGLPAYYRLEYQTIDKDPETDYWNGMDLDESFGMSTGAVITSWNKYSYSDEVSGMITQFGGQKLRLRVRAIPSRTVGRDWGAPSDYIEFTWPTESQIKHEKYPPGRIKPEVTEDDGQITLKWNKRTKLNSDESEATYYQVLRTWGNNYGVVATFPADRTSYEWTDTDVVNGEKYTYELRPCSTYYYRYYSSAWWYHQWCYMDQVTAVPNGKTKDQRIAENIVAFANELLASKPASLDDITSEYHYRVMELRDNFAALTDYQRRLVGKEECAKIEGLIEDVLYHDSELQYGADPALLEVLSAIDGLSAYPEDIGLDSPAFAEYEAAAAAARAAYDALPKDAQRLVANLQKLKDAEAHIKQLLRDAADQAKADDLSDRMAALVPENISADTLTDELERGIEDLRWEYDSMTKAQKAKVREDALENLMAAEEAIAMLRGAVHEHKMKHVEAASPSCTEEGNVAYYKCTKCGKCFTDAAGRHEVDKADVTLPPDAGAHNWGDWTVTKDATCTVGGTEERVCRNDASHKETRTFESYDHDWDTGVITKEATTDEDGIITFTCGRCGITREARIEVHEGACANTADHVWGEPEVTVEATCSAPGEIKSVCERCGVAIKYETQIDPLAHAWGEWNVTKQETCTESGSREHTCGLCGETESVLIEAAGHNWDEGTLLKEATCSHTGLKTFTCRTCGDTKTDILPATEDHAWDEGTLVRRASKDETGLKVYVCGVCGLDKTDIIPVVKATVKLNRASYVWNGKVRTPSVTVTNNGVVLDPSQYEITLPAGRKNVGAYTVRAELQGDLIGTAKATLRIVPMGTSLAKLKKGKGSFTVKWRKQSSKMPKARITGYEIQYSTKGNFKSGNKKLKIKGYKKTSAKITKLKKKKYYVRIRTYMKTGGKTLYSPWSKAKTVRVR